MGLAVSAGAATWSQIMRVGVTLGTHIVLRRFIPPEEMGVWTWAEALFVLLAQVRDLGIPAEIARQRSPKYGNYLLVLVSWSSVLAAIIFLFAPLLANGYSGDPGQTTAALRWMCLFLVIQGLGVLPTTFLDVQMQTIRTIPAELLRNLCFAVGSIFLATQGYGIWSIFYAHVGAAAIYTLGVWWAARKLLVLETRASEIRSLVVASLPLMVLSFLELAIMGIEAIVLGYRFPPAAVGNAGLAILVAFFISRQIADACGRPLYPAMLNAGSPQQSFEVYAAATLLFVGIVTPAAFGVFLNADLLADLLGGDRWAHAADYIRWFAFVPLLRPLSLFGRELLLILRQDRLLLIYSALSLLSIGGLGWILTGTRLGPFGMAVAGFFPLGQLILLIGLRTIPGCPLGRLLKRIVVVVAANTLVFLPLLAVRDLLSHAGMFVASFLVSLAAVGLLLYAFRESARSLMAITTR